MDQRLHFITLATRDLDAARQFYQLGLGWEPTLDVSGEIIFYRVAPGLLLGLFDSENFAEDLGGGRAPRVSGVTLSHNVASPDAVRTTVEAMAAAGATVLKQPQQGMFGGIFHAHIQDPNGIVWEIAHNPAWSVTETGDVVLG
jgi:catechol 2,3-dioxygenase-like lactoylglutathione lyase family enzyme